MKRLLLIPVAVLLSLSFVGCGASAEDKEGTPGTTDKDYSSNTEREFTQPDEFYDLGDFDKVKVFHLSDGTECVLVHVGGNSGRSDMGAGVDCGFPTVIESTSTSTPTP